MKKLNFYEELFKLKNILRRGWIKREVNGRIESDAEHSMSMILMALAFMSKNDLNLDQYKVVKMIAFHELCEIDAGDVIPSDNIDTKTKYQNEHKCIMRLAKDYNMPEIEKLWVEFEENKTPEAQFVKKLDKYDSVLQAQEYEKNHFTDNQIYEEFRNCYKQISDEFSSLNF